MKKTETKPKSMSEGQWLALLKRVLPKATQDSQLAGKIYQAIEQELKSQTRETAFDRFCGRVELPDLEAKTLHAVEKQFADSFGEADVTLKPNRKENSLAVEVAMPDGAQFRSEIKVRTGEGEEEGDAALVAKFIPFPVSLSTDPELVWMLGKRETLAPQEAAVALSKLEDDFWASKTGQKLLRDRVERTFAEFIARVPAGMLVEAGLKRHYKMPEALKTLRSAAAAKRR